MNMIALKASDELFTEWESIFKKFNPRINLRMENYSDSTIAWEGEAGMPFLKAKSKFLMDPLQPAALQGSLYFQKLAQDQVPIIVFLNLGHSEAK